MVRSAHCAAGRWYHHVPVSEKSSPEYETPSSEASTTDPGAGPPGRLASWDGSLYAANTGHHRATDAWFLEGFPARPSDRVLDVGCGAGDFTAVLAGLVPTGQVVGLDPQPSMLVEARRVALANQSFVLGAAQELGRLFPEAAFDGVVSRAVLHWVPAADHPVVYRGVLDLLRPGGWFRLEMGGAGNVSAVRTLMEDAAARHGGPGAPWTFLDAGRLYGLLEEAGFEIAGVRTVAQRRSFTRDGLLGWVRSQAVQAWAPSMSAAAHRAFCAEVESRLDELRRLDGTYDQVFVRADASVRRPG